MVWRGGGCDHGIIFGPQDSYLLPQISANSGIGRAGHFNGYAALLHSQEYSKSRKQCTKHSERTADG